MKYLASFPQHQAVRIILLTYSVAWLWIYIYTCHNICYSLIENTALVKLLHDDVSKWKHFLRYWPFVRGIHRSPVNSPHTEGQWRRALIFSLIYAWTNGWVNDHDAVGLRRRRAHYHATVMPYDWSVSGDRDRRFPSRQKASNTEYVSIAWRHHVLAIDIQHTIHIVIKCNSEEFCIWQWKQLCVNCKPTFVFKTKIKKYNVSIFLNGLRQCFILSLT